HLLASPALYTLSLHDALPICRRLSLRAHRATPGSPASRERTRRPSAAVSPWTDARTATWLMRCQVRRTVASILIDSPGRTARGKDRKSTRLNSSHSQISYAVF